MSKSITYDLPESAVVFRIAWYVVASQPGVLLTEYSEAESTDFKGDAKFTSEVEGKQVVTQLCVEEAQTSVELSAYGNDTQVLTDYVDTLLQYLGSSIEKYQQLNDDEKGKLRRALVAKTCWDRVVHYILAKDSVSTIYFQVAHGREMMIKATEGEEMHPLTLSTSGWLSKIEKFPRDETMPSEFAIQLAKKSVEWKKETHKVIEQYLTLQP